MIKKIKNIFLFTIFLSIYSFCENFERISCVLHIHSEFSGKGYPIGQIVDIAKQNKIDCVILNDHFLQKVEFGLWPVRQIVKKTVDLPSVMRLGVDRYLYEIYHYNSVQKDVIVLPGLEVTPHYFFSVDEGSLVINNLHKHILVIGLDKKDIYFKMPVVGNEVNIRKVNIKSLWPILGIFLSITLKSKVLFIIFFIALLNNFPFLEKKYNQYKNFKEAPYQELIDYINRCSSDYITIWAHPEATNYEEKKLIKKFKNLKVFTQTKPYYDSLIKTFDYDGFSIFAEGYRKIGYPEGVWDKLLVDYCEAKRKKPVWCYAEVDFGETDDFIYSRKNILFLKEKNPNSILYGLKNGNFYAVYRDATGELILSDFKICNRPVIFGNRYRFEEDILNFEFSVSFSNNYKKSLEILIIKDGKILYRFENVVTPQKVVFSDKVSKKLSYYRIWVESNYPHMIATNPVFIEQ